MAVKHLLLLIGLSFFAFGCGLDTEEDESESGSGTVVAVGVDQNVYLPLTDGTSIYYEDPDTDDEVTSDISFDQEYSNEKGVPIYKISFNPSDTDFGSVNLFISTTPSSIKLYKIGGPISFDSATTLNSIDFEPVITIYDGSSQTSGTVEGLVDTTDFSGTYDFDYTSVEGSNTFDSAYGILPVVTVDLNLSGTILSIPINIDVSLMLAKGLGVVSNTMGVGDVGIAAEITQLIGLPNTTWFDNNAGDPLLASGSRATFYTGGGNISSDNYFVVNQDVLDSLDWITVSEDTASKTFNVSMNSSNELPSSLYSLQILFEHIRTGKRLSGNITLHEEVSP